MAVMMMGILATEADMNKVMEVAAAAATAAATMEVVVMVSTWSTFSNSCLVYDCIFHILTGVL